MENLIFKTKALFDEVWHNGFAVVDFTSPQFISKARIAEKYFLSHNRNPHAHFDSLTVDNPALTAQIHTMLVAAFEQDVNRFFYNYKLPVCMLLSKKPGSDSGISMHQDPSLLRQEDQEQHLGIWIPLVDTDQHNGSMRVISGSHRFFPPIQALSLPPVFDKIRNELEEFATPINLKVGQALIFDNRILHSSFANNSILQRTAAIIRITHNCAQYINFHFRADADQIDVTHHSDDFYLAHSYKQFRSIYPSLNQIVETFSYEPEFINLHQFKEKVKLYV